MLVGYPYASRQGSDARVALTLTGCGDLRVTYLLGRHSPRGKGLGSARFDCGSECGVCDEHGSFEMPKRIELDLSMARSRGVYMPMRGPLRKFYRVKYYYQI